MVLSFEWFVTNITLERSFSCVCSLVDGQIVRLGEVSSTEATDELLPAARSRLCTLLCVAVQRWRSQRVKVAREEMGVVDRKSVSMLKQVRPILHVKWSNRLRCRACESITA